MVFPIMMVRQLITYMARNKIRPLPHPFHKEYTCIWKAIQLSIYSNVERYLHDLRYEG